MQMDFTSSLHYFDGGYEWWDSKDYSMLLIGFAGKNRPKSPDAQRRLRCNATRKEIQEQRFRKFNPFTSSPSMFLEFSELDGSEKSILEFTNQYGRLWEGFYGPSLADYRDAID